MLTTAVMGPDIGRLIIPDGVARLGNCDVNRLLGSARPPRGYTKSILARNAP